MLGRLTTQQHKEADTLKRFYCAAWQMHDCVDTLATKLGYELKTTPHPERGWTHAETPWS